MRRPLALLALSALVSLGLPAFVSGPADASVTVSGPSCESGDSQILCNTTAPGTPATVTWNVTGVTYPGPDSTEFNCQLGQSYMVSYSWTASGVTYTSTSTHSPCRTQPWQ